jgi:FlaA1/EpsC-like NDP-sugar epimerase
MSITDIARAVAPNVQHKIIGVRPGEKIHEQMIGLEDAPHTFEYEEHYKILPVIHDWSSDASRIQHGRKVPEDFVYTSDNNTEWMDVATLADWIQLNRSNLNR